MIQRRQTLWLLLAAACSFLTIKFSFYSGNKLGDNQAKTFEYLNATSSILLLILTVSSVSAIVIDIFLYKNRKLQMRIAIASLLVSIINIVLFVKQTENFVEGNYDLGSILPFIVPIFLILAAMGIYKDQKLVKSLDRLR
ncbi:MAG: DUF4293 domain-containing protein [Chitinophagales bacterium]